MCIVEKLNIAINNVKEETNNGKRKSQYVQNYVPEKLSKADILFNELVDDYLLLTNEEKDNIKKLVTEEMAYYLLGFGIRMATYSLRLSNKKYFINGLFALSIIVGILYDLRDLLVILPLYCDVQKKNNFSFSEILRQNDEFSSVLKEFIKRDEKDKTLECMGYILGMDEGNNQIYKRTW